MNTQDQTMLLGLLKRYSCSYISKWTKTLALDAEIAKTCPSCNQLKNDDEYYIRPTGRLQHYCKECHKAKMRDITRRRKNDYARY